MGDLITWNGACLTTSDKIYDNDIDNIQFIIFTASYDCELQGNLGIKLIKKQKKIIFIILKVIHLTYKKNCYKCKC